MRPVRRKTAPAVASAEAAEAVASAAAEAAAEAAASAAAAAVAAVAATAASVVTEPRGPIEFARDGEPKRPPSLFFVTEAAIRKHQSALRRCNRCPRMGKPVVVGRPVPSRIMLVGQAPGDKEPLLGRPFAWTAGKTLFKWFAGALGWSEDEVRDRIYFAAACRCFPGKLPKGGDRVPSPDEVAACAPWLEREFELLRPSLLIPVGRLAIDRFLEPAP